VLKSIKFVDFTQQFQQETFMAAQTATVIDLQSYRQSRAKAASSPVVAVPHAVPMQPMLVWVPYWGFMPVMMMGHGA
jgi:hypothetical protein